jgi:hypothetical protein
MGTPGTKEDLDAAFFDNPLEKQFSSASSQKYLERIDFKPKVNSFDLGGDCSKNLFG